MSSYKYTDAIEHVADVAAGTGTKMTKWYLEYKIFSQIIGLIMVILFAIIFIYAIWKTPPSELTPQTKKENFGYNQTTPYPYMV